MRFTERVVWSTRELAELAGTTVKAVRHYHEVGLLAEPERAANGYKRYRTSHLVRLLRIRRLSDLGLSLAEIERMAGAAEPDLEALRALDAELAATIARAERARADLAVLLEHRAPGDTLPPFGPVAERLDGRGRDFVTVLGGVFDEAAVADLGLLVAAPDTADDTDFDQLPADADEAAVESLAQRLAARVRRDHERLPWLRDPAAAARGGRRRAEEVMATAVAEIFNPAQVRALVRVQELLADESGDSAPGA
jgi:MerR family transcriptional regulator, thiopeptide resistance regulator